MHSSLVQNWEYKEICSVKNPSKVILLLHGLGSNYLDMENLAIILYKIFNYKKDTDLININNIINDFNLNINNLKDNSISYLQNIFKDYVSIIAVNGVDKHNNCILGRQWFSLEDRTQNVIQKEVHGAYIKFKEFLNIIKNKYSLLDKDIGIIGFSQGGILGCYTAIMENIGVSIGLSSCAIGPNEIKEQSKTPICFIHGTEDDIITMDLFENSLNIFNKCFIKPIDKFLIKNLKHAIDLSGIQYTVKFMIDNNFLSIEKN
ncbi:MAG: dienelactone hydrolase family protein [Rickettsiales bacterium]